MRLFEILLLLAFCLVFAKTDDEKFSDTLNDVIDTDDEVIIENLGDGTDIAAETASMEDSPNEEVRRQIIKPPILRPVTVPIAVPGNTNSFFVKTCYCYRRFCYG